MASHPDNIPTVTSFINYCNVSIRMHCEIELLTRIRAELEPFFEFDYSQTTEPTLDFYIYNGQFDEKPTEPGYNVSVDTSLYKHLSSEGTRWGNKDKWIVQIALTNSWFRFNALEKSVEMFQPNSEQQLVDGARFIKGLITPALEKKGAVQIHSSGAVVDGKAILILGDMWQGKTTLLLELLSKFNVKQLSCDTVVLSPIGEDAINAHGWPSPFSMSHGTMLDHEVLHQFIPEHRLYKDYATLWQEGKKTVLTSQQVVDLFKTEIQATCEDISICLIAEFNPDKPIGITNITTEDLLVDYLQRVYLGSRDPIYHNWHGFITCSDEEVEANIRDMARRLMIKGNVRLFTWAPSAESLMKTIPMLVSSHKSIGKLLRN